MSHNANFGVSLPAVSLFSGAGIGDLGFRAAGMTFLAMCELEEDRAALGQLNFPEAKHFRRSIEDVGDELCSFVESKLADSSQDLFLVSCTAPCQGMSKNGQGTLLNNIRKGIRPKLDARNRLILPALEVIERLKPRFVVFENVWEMRNTLIMDRDDELRQILEIIRNTLTPLGYVGEAYDVEIADYGVPQRRQRLITIYTRDEVAAGRYNHGISLLPKPTHAKHATRNLSQWQSVGDALAGFPPLDSLNERDATCSSIPFHYVPILDPKKYEWIRNTPLCRSAFDNQCVNPNCGFTGNVTHGASHDSNGINRAHKNTPLFCEKCGELLPRPYTQEKNGSIRIMSGYTSAYKRMDGSLPAPALTRNLSYPCSDQKVHPTQNRVLSLAEAIRLQTIDRYIFKWGPLLIKRGRGMATVETAPDSLIRLVIGESVPPQFFEILAEHLKRMSNPAIAFEVPIVRIQKLLFD